jgi:DNA-binding beta-propeller fold protein YncE
MALTVRGIIEIPDAHDASFDHGAFDPKSRRVFVAHTGHDRLEVIDHDTSRHIATLAGFSEAAGVVALDGSVLVTNRGTASLAWVDAITLETRAVFQTAPRPNGVAITSSPHLAIAACIGDDTNNPELHVFDLDTRDQWSLKLPGRPRWCVPDASNTRVFLAIRGPTMVLVASLPDLRDVRHWPLPSGGAHGMDIDHDANLLYVACDGGALVELHTQNGKVTRQWPLAGVPDATFFNSASGLVHVAIADPGLVESIDPRTGTAGKIVTAKGAKTTAFVAPDRLYVLSPAHGGILELTGA